MTAGAARDRVRVAAVVIGRNEGERLRRCLTSLLQYVDPVVYVDSGSTDGSPDLAAGLGARVAALDTTKPFTAARARNLGFARVLEAAPEVTCVQFVDGDCEVVPGWLDKAVEYLATHQDCAAVCGRRRERHPERSVYNLLCDIEWNTPIGEARAFGGDVLMRSAALRQVDGYRSDLIAGEEPELGVRLRQKAWRIWRLDAEMTWHDAAITSFGQWWQRTLRAGFAFAQGTYLHGGSPARLWVRETRSAWGWGVVLPLSMVVAAGFWTPWVLTGVFVYPIQVARLFARESGTTRARAARAFFLVLGKFPEGLGVLRFLVQRYTGATQVLIEYK
jgi:GT2 family glycosyltransferase